MIIYVASQALRLSTLFTQLRIRISERGFIQVPLTAQLAACVSHTNGCLCLIASQPASGNKDVGLSKPQLGYQAPSSVFLRPWLHA